MSAPAELVIEVTAEDIALGERYHIARSPIGRAVLRLLGRPLQEHMSDATISHDHVELDVWRLDDPNVRDVYRLPDEASLFDQAFDEYGPDGVSGPVTFTALFLETRS